MKAVRVESYGGTDQLVYKDIEKPEPRPGEAVVRIGAIGVNFLDVYHRTGLHPLPLPFTPGTEAAGTVESIGSEAGGVAVGDRVAYAMAVGSYAEYAAAPAARLVRFHYASFASQVEARRAFLELWRDVERLGSAEEVESAAERWLERQG